MGVFGAKGICGKHRNLEYLMAARGGGGGGGNEGRGNILLILHKNAQGTWKIKQEMWNAASKERAEPKAQ
jgi:hypothetical protein